MDLGEKLGVLIQGCELAQKAGLLSLDEAVAVKFAIDSVKNGKDLKTSVDVLTKVVTRAQKNGTYTFRDSYYLYLALTGLDADIDAAVNPTVPAQPVAETEEHQDKKKKK